MERCRSCRFWGPIPVTDYPGVRESRGGICLHVRLGEVDHQEIAAAEAGIVEDGWSNSDRGYHSDALVYPYNEGIDHFWTGPDFGCVHHMRRSE